MKDSRIIFLINRHTKEYWKELAVKNNISLSSLIITAINKYAKEVGPGEEEEHVPPTLYTYKGEPYYLPNNSNDYDELDWKVYLGNIK